MSDTLVVTELDVEIIEVVGDVTTVIETGDTTTIITTNDDVSVVTADSTDIVVVEPDVLRNVEILTTGEQGPPGRDGSSLSGVISMTAAITLSGHRAIRSDGTGQATYASNTDVGDGNAVLGISTGSALAGATVDVQYAGSLIEPSWNWTPNAPVFCGANGVLTQAAPVTGFALIVGVAIAPTVLALGVKQPIFTA